jgi:uncharacterized membrane protein
MRDPVPDDADGLELAIARLLTIGTYVAVALLAVGVALLLAAGRSPLEGGPALDASRLIGDIAAARPEGFLWLGLVAVIATPASRVAAALVGYAARGERAMVAVAAGILGIIILSILLGIGTEA